MKRKKILIKRNDFEDFQLLPTLWKNNISCIFSLTYLTKAIVYSSNPSLQATSMHISNCIFTVAWHSYQIVWWKWVTNTTKWIVIFRWKWWYRQRCWHYVSFFFVAVLFYLLFFLQRILMLFSFQMAPTRFKFCFFPWLLWQKKIKSKITATK